MDLPIFKKNDEKNLEHFWALSLGKDWVDSAVWKVVGQETQIVAAGGVFPYQPGNVDSIVEAADGSLSNAASVLPEDAAQPSKVVFGLSPTYLADGGLKKECVEILKKLSHELELSPAGFVVIPEAIIHFLKIQEGGVISAILIGASEETLEVSLVQNGKNVGTSEVGRSMSIGADVAEGLARLGQVYQYPTRIILYDHKSADLENARQALMEVEWDKHNITFLHTPKVEALPAETAISAVSLAGGAEVAGATSLAGAIVKRQNVSLDELVKEAPEEQLLGLEHANVETVSPEALGFRGEGKTLPIAVPPIATPSFFANAADLISNVHIPRVRLPRVAGGKKKTVFLAGIILLAFLLGFSYWVLPTARVLVYVSPKHLEQDINFSVGSQNSNVNVVAKTIPGRYVEIEKTVNASRDTTGTKKIGDRATGEVMVNRVGPAVTLPRGTVLTASGLKFTLDKDVKVASGSGLSSIGHNIDPATVTASDIGTNSNIAAGQNFKIGVYPTAAMDAKNDKAFSGGTSRDISAVAVLDLQTLENDATTDIKNQAEVEVKNQLGQDEVLIGGGGAVTVGKKDLSAKVGEEAKMVNLNLTGKVSFLVVKRADLAQIIEGQAQIPEGFTLQSDQVEVEAKSSKDGNYNAGVRANLLPKVNPVELVARIAGRSTSGAREVLSQTPGFVRAEVNLKPKLPLLGTLPHMAGHISLEVVAQ